MNDVTILDLTNDEYHARPEWSNSQVKLLPNEVELFGKRHIEKQPAFQFKPTASVQLGTAVHDIILENTPIVMIPESALSASGSKAGKGWTSLRADNPGKVLCKPDDPILHMAASIRAEPKAREWLESEGPVEQSICWHDDVSGLDLRAKPDKVSMTSQGNVIIDLKSTKEDPHSERQIAKAIHTLCYHRQGAWYWDPVEWWLQDEVRLFMLIFVRNKPPYDCHVHELAGRAIELGRQQNRLARGELASRLQTKNWLPETHGRTTVIDLPDWAYNQEEENYE